MHNLPENRKPEEAGNANDLPLHQNIWYPTKDCYILKDKIQTLIDTKMIQLRSE